jgi:hypothetical protein
VLLTKDGYVHGHNVEAALDAEAQIIVAHGLTQSMSDRDAQRGSDSSCYAASTK